MKEGQEFTQKGYVNPITHINLVEKAKKRGYHNGIKEITKINILCLIMAFSMYLASSSKFVIYLLFFFLFVINLIYLLKNERKKT